MSYFTDTGHKTRSEPEVVIVVLNMAKPASISLCSSLCYCFLVILLNVRQTVAQSCKLPTYKDQFLTLMKKLQLQGHFNREKSGFSVCSSQDKPEIDNETQTWQPVEDHLVKVFSAFYEERPLADGPAIRIIGVGWQAAYNDMPDIFCNFWYDDLEYAIASAPAIYNVIYPSHIHTDLWCSHFIICKLPYLPGQTKLRIPKVVSVVPSPCHKETNRLLVLNREPVKKKGQLGLCWSPIYNKFNNWTMIVEMHEMYRILGVRESTTYEFSMRPQTAKVLKYYASTGMLNLVQWPIPPIKTNVLAQRAALNDCLYRMGHKYHYVIVLDLDELIVPRATDDLLQLLERLYEPEYGSYLFQHAYFRRNYDAIGTVNPYLITMTSFERTEKCVPVGKVRSKPIFVPEKTISIDLHYAYKLVEGYEELVVPEKEGFLHHYRSTPMEYFIKYSQNYTYIEDRYMEKYKSKLETSFLHAMEMINHTDCTVII